VAERDGDMKEERERSLRVNHAHVLSHFRVTEEDIYPTTHRVR
jgi:hypothetical protein